MGDLVTERLTGAWLAENLEHWREHGFGLWTFEGRSEGFHYERDIVHHDQRHVLDHIRTTFVVA